MKLLDDDKWEVRSLEDVYFKKYFWKLNRNIELTSENIFKEHLLVVASIGDYEQKVIEDDAMRDEVKIIFDELLFVFTFQSRFEANCDRREFPSEIIHNFWCVVHEMTETQEEDLLRFVTSRCRPPPFGFMTLQICFKISVTLDVPSWNLPSVSTCNNTLLLPGYENKDILKEILLKAIANRTGYLSQSFLKINHFI